MMHLIVHPMFGQATDILSAVGVLTTDYWPAAVALAVLVFLFVLGKKIVKRAI